jgi:hypothetical protein
MTIPRGLPVAIYINDLAANRTLFRSIGLLGFLATMSHRPRNVDPHEGCTRAKSGHDCNSVVNSGTTLLTKPADEATQSAKWPYFVVTARNVEGTKLCMPAKAGVPALASTNGTNLLLFVSNTLVTPPTVFVAAS